MPSDQGRFSSNLLLSTKLSGHQTGGIKSVVYIFSILDCSRVVQFLNLKTMAFNLPKGKSKNGNLIQVLPSGATTTLVSNKPFPELQLKKKAYIQRGYSADTLKVTNLKPQQK